MRNVTTFDRSLNQAYAKPTFPHWNGGFGSPFSLGARAMRRQAHGFFNALASMVGGIWEAARLAGPKPGLPTRISSIAQGLVAPVDGLNHRLGVVS